MSLATKYRPQRWEDVTEQDTVINIISKLCDQEELENRNFLFIGPAGTGKAQPLHSHILTPEGFIEMRDVHEGTEVFTSTGEHARVSGVYPQGTRPIYAISLSDGTTIEVSDEHLNVVYRYNEDRKKRQDYTLTTLELIDLFNTSRFKLRIDIPEVDWPETPVPMNPYLMGVLIGDGSFSSGNCGFSNAESDVIEKVDQLLRETLRCYLEKIPGDNVDYSIKKLDFNRNKYLYSFRGVEYKSQSDLQQALMNAGYPWIDAATIHNMLNGINSSRAKQYPELLTDIKILEDHSDIFQQPHPVLNIIRSLNLDVPSIKKHIPECYLHNSREVRKQILQGLIDTDGYTDKQGQVSFNTSSPQLSEDFAFLVRSLGIRDHVVRSKSSYVNPEGVRVECQDSYTHNLKIDNEFKDYATSMKHMGRWTKKQNPPIRNIVSIEYVRDEECQCIYVDHPDHTYISDGFIPTHNTTTARIMADVLNDGQGTPIEIDAASHNGVDSVREIVNQARMYPVGSKYKVFVIDECHSFSQQAWQIFLKPLEDAPAKSVFIFCTTNPEKIPATIISRVQTFQLSKISLKGIYNRLIYVIDQENSKGAGITYTPDAVNFIAKLANGGMRDSLTTLDKALAFTHDLTSESVAKALNLPEYDDYFRLLGAYSKKDNQTVSQVINDVYNSGVNFVKWFEGFHSFVMNVVKYIFLQDINLTMIPSHYQEKIAKYGTAHSVVCLKLANKLLKLNYELKTTQYLQEVALTYLCQLPQQKKEG